MKVRHFKKYNRHIIQQLHEIFNDYPESQQRLKHLLKEAKIRQKNRKRREARARKTKKLAELKNSSPEFAIPPPEPNLPEPNSDSELENSEALQEPDNTFGNTYYFHVKSHSHLRRYFFNDDKTKEIINDQCIHYARVCKVGILHYAIMNNHLHLLVVVQADSYKNARKQVSKMIGCIKQQFTNRYKNWYNEELRVTMEYRIPSLETGSLWDGPAKIELIEDEVDLAACTLLIEANWLRDSIHEKLTTLTEAPTYISPLSDTDNTSELPDKTPTTSLTPTTCFQPDYNELAQCAANNRFQSIPWYLKGGKGHPRSALTDGTDANWAPPDEFERLWPLPVRELPHGYRKCWFKDMLGIIRPTPQKARRFHISPFIKQLGTNPDIRAEKLIHLILSTCWEMGPSRYRNPQDANMKLGM